MRRRRAHAPAWAAAGEPPFPLRVLAPNPGPYTLEGTNTWIVGRDPALVIDPGPDEPSHLHEVARSAGDIAAILITHRHPDHAPGAGRLASLSGAKVLTFRPGPGQAALGDGDEVRGGGVVLTARRTPGHTPDHLAFVEDASGILFTGDAVLGRGTSVIDPPEGDLADYLRSLEVMIGLHPAVIAPGHGPVVWAAQEKLQEYLAHRATREREVLSGMGSGPRSPLDLVPAIYAGYPEAILPAAARSILAHLLKLEREGRVRRVPEEANEEATEEVPDVTQRFALTDHGAAPGPRAAADPVGSTGTVDTT